MTEYTLTDEQSEAVSHARHAGTHRDLEDLIARMVADAKQQGYWEGRDAEFNERIKYGIETGSLTEYALDHAKAAARAEVSAAVEEALGDVAQVPPREYDAKTRQPQYAHERCKQPHCSLRPWGLGNVTPEEPRYCPYHEALHDASLAVRAALTDPAADVAQIEAKALREAADRMERRARWKFLAGNRIWQASLPTPWRAGAVGDERALHMCAAAGVLDREAGRLRARADSIGGDA